MGGITQRWRSADHPKLRGVKLTSYLIIVNPKSGRGDAVEKAARLRDRLSSSNTVEVVETTGRGSASSLAADSSAGFQRIIAVGGDGTLNEVLSGLLMTDRPAAQLPALGFLPAGTANAAVRAFGFTQDPIVMADSMADVACRAVDVGVARTDADERPFLLWCGAGFDAVLIDTLNSSRTGHMGIGGLVSKSPRVLKALSEYSAPPIQVSVDGRPRGTGVSIIIANVADMAFGGTVTAAADPFDGNLDVVTVESASSLNLPFLALRMLTSGLVEADGVRHDTGSRISLESDEPVPVQVDGEPMGLLPLSVELRPAAITLLLT